MALVEAAAREGKAVHELEQALWHQLRQLGHQCLSPFFAWAGEGDLGETVRNDDGQEWQRLERKHSRRYVSLFGTFERERVVYGSREGPKIAFVPLDHRLPLPASVYAYLLQDWSQGLCVASAFGRVSASLPRIFAVDVSVDGLERVHEQRAERVADWRLDRPKPAAATEGEVHVASADGKGLVKRRSADDPAPAAHRGKGDKASQKRVARVARVSTVDRHVRTPAEVVAALFRDRRPRDEPRPQRPEPQHKRGMASLPQMDEAGVSPPAVALVHAWRWNERVERNRQPGAWQRPLGSRYDGQESRWEARAQHLPAPGAEILDFLPVTPRWWQAAPWFHREGSDAAERFVRERCLRVLPGNVAGVLRGLREMGTKHGLTGSPKKTLTQLCNSRAKNRGRLRYDEYLAAGSPLASDVLEGACRQLVQDRSERAGLHGTPPGAQAMLDVRSVFLEGSWDAYQTYRIEREGRLLSPHRHLLEGCQYAMAC